MKERPIIFSAESVRAILDGRKTQTRRALKPQPISVGVFLDVLCADTPKGRYVDLQKFSPFGKPGNLLWVKEPYALDYIGLPFYQADWPTDEEQKWRNVMYMKRDYSRLTLEIVNVRVERLQDISEADARAEGVKPFGGMEAAGAKYIHSYRELWDKLNAKRGFQWESNPWVWVIEFKQLTQR